MPSKQNFMDPHGNLLGRKGNAPPPKIGFLEPLSCSVTLDKKGNPFGTRRAADGGACRPTICPGLVGQVPTSDTYHRLWQKAHDEVKQPPRAGSPHPNTHHDGQRQVRKRHCTQRHQARDPREKAQSRGTRPRRAARIRILSRKASSSGVHSKRTPEKAFRGQARPA